MNVPRSHAASEARTIPVRVRVAPMSNRLPTREGIYEACPKGQLLRMNRILWVNFRLACRSLTDRRSAASNSADRTRPCRNRNFVVLVVDVRVQLQKTLVRGAGPFRCEVFRFIQDSLAESLEHNFAKLTEDLPIRLWKFMRHGGLLTVAFSCGTATCGSLEAP